MRNSALVLALSIASLASPAFGANVTGPNTSVVGHSAPWSNTTGSTVVDGGGPCNVIANGADPTGVADSYTAIHGLWTSSCPVIYVPPGTYKMGTNLAGPATDGAGIIGAGSFSTVFNFTTTTGDAITSATSINHPQFKGFTLSRATTAMSGCGLQMNTSNDMAEIRDLLITKSFNGLCLQGTGYSTVEDVRADHNGNYGVYMNWPPAGNALQWQMLNVLASNSTSDGFHISATGTGSGAVSVGNWRGLATFANGGYGIYMAGLAQIRLSDSFFGADQKAEVWISDSTNTGYAHLLTNVAVEASAGDYGFRIDSTNASPISLVNCAATGNSLAGAFFYSQNSVRVIGGEYKNNGAGGNSYGLFSYSSGNITIIGVDATTGGNQMIGFNIGSGVNNVTLVGSQGSGSCLAATCNLYGNY